MWGAIRGTRTVTRGCAIAATLCLLCGCTPANRPVELHDLQEVGWTSIGSHFWLSVSLHVPPGLDRERFAEAAERYLRTDPALLDRAPLDFFAEPMPPRQRDLLADFVADVRGVAFLLPRSESEEDRDERIERLLCDIELKEEGKTFYIEDFMARDEDFPENDFPDLDVRKFDLQQEDDHYRMIYKLREDIDRDAFVDLAVTYLRSNPTALKDLDPTNELFEDGIRDQDEWATVAADIEGVPFELLSSESPYARDQRIEAMLKAVTKKRRE